MSDRLAEFGHDVDVALISFSSPETMRAYQEQSNLAFPIVLVDVGAYQLFGLARASTSRVWGLRVARRYVSILRREGMRALRRRADAKRTPNEDTRQLGGDFVVDEAGRLSYGFWSVGPDDRPSVDDLLDATARPDASEGL